MTKKSLLTALYCAVAAAAAASAQHSAVSKFFLVMMSYPPELVGSRFRERQFETDAVFAVDLMQDGLQRLVDGDAALFDLLRP